MTACSVLRPPSREAANNIGKPSWQVNSSQLLKPEFLPSLHSYASCICCSYIDIYRGFHFAITGNSHPIALPSRSLSTMAYRFFQYVVTLLVLSAVVMAYRSQAEACPGSSASQAGNVEEPRSNCNTCGNHALCRHTRPAIYVCYTHRHLWANIDLVRSTLMMNNNTQLP